MKVLCALLMVALAAPASAQFDQFDWTLVVGGDVNAFLQPCCMSFQTDLFGPPGSVATYTTQAPADGRVSVFVDFNIEETVCGAANALKILGGTTSAIGGCETYSTLDFDVASGQTFGFGLKAHSPFWLASLHLSAFSFTPYWVALGGALGGSAGTPALEGHGFLQPGEAFTLELEQARASAPVALIVGLGEANLPFKGGVIVPTLDSVITGLATDGNGSLTLGATWPSGFPAGFEFLVQAWIVDAGGPQGFAASNAVHGEVL